MNEAQRKQRRRANLAAFYNARQEAATSDREVANVMLDRARAAAKNATEDGDAHAWYSLAQTLSDWAAAHGG